MMSLPRAALVALLTSLSPASSALAQSGWEEDDAPIPYSDEVEEEEESSRRERPRRSDPSAEFREEVDWETEERERSLARLDDPFIGVGGNVLVGAVLLDSARGEFAEGSTGVGLRFNWEFGRLIAQEPWDEALFADLTWTWARLRQGTERVFGESHYHFFTVAPAYELHVDRAKAYGFYGQLGGGMAYQSAGITSDEQETTIAGIKPLFQYGVGFRARPAVGEGFRLTFRAELTRFRRSYMNDTLLAVSAGASF